MSEPTPEERTIYRVVGLSLLLVVVHGFARRWVDEPVAWGVASFVFSISLYFALARAKGVTLPLYLLFAAAASGFTYALALLLETIPEF